MRFVAWVVGLPSVLSVAFVGIVGLWYAWQFTADAQTWLALSAGLIAVTLFRRWHADCLGPHAGYPTRGSQGRLRVLAGVRGNEFRHHDALRAPRTGSAGAIAAIARDMPGEEARELDMEIGWRREALADFDADLAPDAPKRKRIRASTPEAQGRHAQLQGELRKLEITRYGAAVTGAAPSRPGSKPGLDLAGVALLMIVGSAVGLAISAS